MRVCGKLGTSCFEQDRLPKGRRTKYCLNSVKATEGDSSGWSKNLLLRELSMTPAGDLFLHR